MDSETFKPVIVALLLFSAATVSARVLDDIRSSSTTIAARLKLKEEETGSDSGWSACWDSLFQLRACTPEVVLFFLNGETYLGPGCCQAIRIIECECWPDLLTALGYTSEEGDILFGYCDATDSLPPISPP